MYSFSDIFNDNYFNFFTDEDENAGLSLITDATFLDDLLPESFPTDAGVVSWSPPMPNWNPWQGCNIDEGPLASANMDQISEDLNTNWSDRQKGDNDLQNSNKSREQLPISRYAMC